MGNVTKTIDGLHASSANELGDAARMAYTHDSFDRVTSQTDAKGQATMYTYNDKGRLASVFYPDGGQVGYTYDGQYTTDYAMMHSEIQSV